MEVLIIVDVQNDFCPGGALAVPNGDKIIPILNNMMEYFDLVIATQDWHPVEHGSFAAVHEGFESYQLHELNGLPQMLWPIHCVQNSFGAQLHPNLNKKGIDKIFYKGLDVAIDSYSGFFDNGKRKSTGLSDFLKEKAAKKVFVAGLATDYCVKFTAIDAANEGFETYFIEDASKGVGLLPSSIPDAIEEMKEKGVRIVQSNFLS